MSFNTALSGIRAANIDLKVTGNNIANAGTTGFKSSRAEFGDVYTSTLLGSTKTSAGSGVNLLATRQQFSQGNLKYTSNSLDLAINGAGFFVVNDNGQQLFTRAGSFGLDKEGYVVGATGAYLQGYQANAEGNVSGIISNLQVNVNTQTPRATTEVVGTYNLSSTENVLETTGTSFATDGPAISVPREGLLTATQSQLNAGYVVVPPGGINLNGTNTQFTVTLSGSSPESGNGTLAFNLNEGVAQSVDDIAQYINSLNYSSTTPLNVEAYAFNNELRFRDLTSGTPSQIQISGVSGGAAAVVGALNTAAGATSTPGQKAVNNNYSAQSLVIQGPKNSTVTYTSKEGASAASTASELNAIAGFTASARTEAKILAANFNNANQNLMLNGVNLKSQTPDALVAEINSLSTSTLPGVTAQLNTQGYLEVVSSVGADFKFSFNDTAPAGNVEVYGRTGVNPQTVNSHTNAVVIGGVVNVVMQEGYAITESVPSVGNIMAPLSSNTFTSVAINSFDPKNQNTYNHGTTTQIYDSLGNSHVMSQYFVKQEYDPTDPSTSPNHWKMYVQIDGKNVGDPDTALPPPANMDASMASYNVHFNMDGTLNENLTDNMLISNWTPLDSKGEPIGALGPLNILQGGTLPVATPTGSSNFQIRLDDSTQFSSAFGTEDLQQNGYTTGRLAGLDVGIDGIIFARFTNGEAQVLGQLALANFNNVDGLKPVGNTMWAQTFETGEAIIGIPNTSSLGQISSGSIEESNVDLSEQLVNLIIAQRNYQANAKTIETANATTQTIINLR